MDNDLIFGTEQSDMLTGAGTDDVQMAAVSSTAAPFEDALTRPFDAAQVVIPEGEDVVRVPVTPGEIVELPFPEDSQFLARIDNGNLAIKVGDVTVILQGYVEAAGQAAPVIEASNGQPIDIATILASTDPNIDIQTAAGPAAGPQGQGADNTGGIFAAFGDAAGLGGFTGAGALDATEGLGGGTVDQTGTLFVLFGEAEPNLAPVAQDDSFKTNEDTAINGQVTVVDPEGDPLVYSVVGTLPNGVTFDPATGNWTFDPTTLKEYQELDTGDVTTIHFDYKAFDGTNFSNTATVTIEVDGVNDAPVSLNDSGVTNEDTKITGQVTSTDVDKNDTLTYAVVGALPPGVTFDPATGKWAFDPTGISDYQKLQDGQTAQISFQYKTNDGTVDSNTATVTIDVNGVNDAPKVTGGDAGLITFENSPPKDETIQFIVTDVDDNPAMAKYSIDPATLPVGVSFDSTTNKLSLDYNGRYDYLKAGESEVYILTFVVTDAHGGTTTRDVSLEIKGVDNAQDARNDDIYTNLGASAAFAVPEWALLANDGDRSSEDVKSTSFDSGVTTAHVAGTGTNGFVVVADDANLGGSFKYTDNDNSTAIVTVHNQAAGSDLNGTANGDILVGSVGADNIDGKAGNDIIFSLGGADNIHGGAGDDIMFFSTGAQFHGDADTVTKDGGLAKAGNTSEGDVLVVSADLKLGDPANAAGLDGIETISMEGKYNALTSGQSLTIGAGSVQQISDHTITPGGVFTNDKDTLRIDGDAVDELYLSITHDAAPGGSWVNTGQVANGYQIYAHETVNGDATTADAYVMVHAGVTVHTNTDQP